MNTQKIKIEFVHDLVCSWCPIGLRNIQAALAEFEGQLDPEIRFLPYELNPKMGDEGELIDSYLQVRNGWDDSKIQRYREEVTGIAAEAGLVYDYSKRTHYWNTRKAHVLMHLAEKGGHQIEMNDLLIQAYFKKGRNLSDEAVLLEVADTLGIGKHEFLSALNSANISAEMAQKKERVLHIGVSRVPTFIVDRKEVLQGSNSVAYFQAYFSAYIAERAA